MFPTANTRRAREGGFTLIEVIVSLGLLVIVSSAVLTTTVVSLRSAAAAKFQTQAKGIGQGQLELMRNLPFHVGQAAGNYRDVLDTYFPNKVLPATAPTDVTCTDPTARLAVPSPAWSGYVPAIATRCSYEPQIGSFYRKIIPNISAPGIGTFNQVVDTQFITLDTPPLPIDPPASWDAQSLNFDTPVSRQIGVTVATLFTNGSRRLAQMSSTQIASRTITPPTVIQTSDATAVRVNTQLGIGELRLNLGLVSQSGALSATSTSSSVATAGQISTSAGDTATGAQDSSQSPGDRVGPARAVGPQDITGGCQYACFESTQVNNSQTAASNGTPTAGLPSAPVTASMPGNILVNGFDVFTGGALDALSLPRYLPIASFDPTDRTPTVGYSGCQPNGSGVDSVFSSSAYTTSTNSASSHQVETCATSQSRTVELFNTTFAPRGVVQVELDNALALCNVTVSGGTATATTNVHYTAKVRYWNGIQYVSAGTVTEGSTTDPLAGINLGTTTVGIGHVLSDYVSNWALLVTPAIVNGNGTTASVDLPGIFHVVSQPLRAFSGNSGGGLGNLGSGPADPNSFAAVTVGDLDCTATDLR